MKVQTFSILAGSAACNARCPFCVSKMTPPRGIKLKEPGVNWERFRKAAQYAVESGAQTAMLTGKGEPTLFPEQITQYLDAMREFNFGSIELQTNGIPLAERREKYERHLQDWHDRGLDLVAVSIVHYDPERNRQIYLPYKKSYIDLPQLIQHLHDDRRRFAVRLSCVALDTFIDSAGQLEELMKFARRNGVEQLTVRPVNKTDVVDDPKIAEWIKQYHLKDEQVDAMRNYLSRRGRPVLELPFGATVYDVCGQNVCLTNSLTRDLNPDYQRQLIFFPDGRLMPDWQYGGEVKL